MYDRVFLLQNLVALCSEISMIPVSGPKNLRLEIIKMKKWQESRNYRRIKDENGNIISNIITVDGIDVEVTEEVFLAYSQAERHERYISEELEPGKILSLNKLLEDGVPLQKMNLESEQSAEDVLLTQSTSTELKQLKHKLAAALTSLREDDRKLIQALYFAGVSTRKYACAVGVTQRAIIKRRNRILRDLKKFFENFQD